MSWLALAFAVAACANKSPDEQLVKDIDPAASWIATIGFASQAWAGNQVPATFTKNTIAAARKNLGDTLQSLDESKATPALVEAVRTNVRAGNDAADNLRAAIERGDRAEAARVVVRCAAAYKALHAIQQQHEQ